MNKLSTPKPATCQCDHAFEHRPAILHQCPRSILGRGARVGLALAAGWVLSLILAGCGGGSSSSAGSAVMTPAASSTSLSGAVVDAYIVSAQVTPYQVNADGSIGAAIACVPASSCPAASDANGNYTIDLGSYSGPVILQATGGTYTDTVTRQVVSLPSGLTLSTILPTVSPSATGITAQLTPFTTLSAQLALQQLAQASVSGQSLSLTSALQSTSTAVGTYFGGLSNLVTTKLLNLGLASCGAAASQESYDASLVLAGISQLASNFQVTSIALVSAIAQDVISDGGLDGLASGVPINVPLASGSGSVPLTTIYGSGLAQSLAASIATFQASAANACQAAASASLGSNLRNQTSTTLSTAMYSYKLNGSISGFTGTDTVALQYSLGLGCTNDASVGMSSTVAKIYLTANGNFTQSISGSPNSYAALNYNNACKTNTWYLSVANALGQSCSISPSSGTFTWTDTIGNHNLSASTGDPVVSCSPILYTVGGTVAGLTTGSVQITNTSNGDTVNVTANGSFTLPSQLPNSSAYNVVATPTSCTVTGGNGAINAGNVTTILVQCSSLAPVALNGQNGLLFANPYLFVANAGGNDVLVYQEQLNSSTNVVSGLTLVANITQGISSPTRLAMDGSGRLYVTNLGANSVTVYDVSNASNIATNAIPQLTNMSITGLNRPLGVAVDPGNGAVYVANNAGTYPYAGSVSVFAPAAGGGFTMPGTTLNYDGNNYPFSAPGSLAVYTVGTSSYIALGLGATSGADSVMIYATPLSASSLPIANLSNANNCTSGPSGPTGTALLASGTPALLVASFYSASVSQYNFTSVLASTSGAAACVTPALQSQSASAVVAPEGIAVDGAGNVFVSNSGNSTITVYAPGGIGSAPVYTQH